MFGNMGTSMNMNPQEYLNGVMSPSMVAGQGNYMSQT